MPNFFRPALRILSGSGFLSRDTSAARVLGFGTGKKFDRAKYDAFLNEPLERQFGFEGAWYDRTNATWVAWRSSLDAILRTSIWILVGRCRDLQRGNSIVKKALNIWRNNVVGPHGIRLRSNVRTKEGKPNDQVNDPVNLHWKYFCMPENLTPAGDMDMVEFQEGIMATVPIDGTALIRIFKGPQFEYGVAFKILELDLLDINKFECKDGAKTETKFGIEKDVATGKTVAYWLYLTNPNDLSLASNYSAGKSFRIPAAEIILVMRRERPMQTIGIPWFVRAMTNLHIIQAYTKATLIKAQMAASYFMFITNQLAVQEGDEGAGGDPNGFQQMPVDNGIAYELKKGQDVKNVSPANVASDMAILFTWSLRFIAGDLDLSYHSLAEDTSQGNYSSLRMELLEERTGHLTTQAWLIRAALRPMFRVWLDIQLMTQKHLKLSDALFQEILYCVSWIAKRWDWIDPKNESAAEISLINAALKSRADYWHERGTSVDEEVSQMEYEQAELEDAGIVIQTSSGQQLEFGQTDATAQTKGAGSGGKPAADDKDDEA